MYKDGSIRILFTIVDIIGVLTIIGGVLLAITGASEARYGGSVFPGIAVAVGGFGCFVVSHIGRSLAEIAKISAAILERLTPDDGAIYKDGGNEIEDKPLLPPGVFYPGQPIGR